MTVTYDERFKEQIERARLILERDVAGKTLEQVNTRIDHLDRLGMHTVANNIRRARDKVFALAPAAPAAVSSDPA